MKTFFDILTLGNSLLYRKSEEVTINELDTIAEIISDMQNALDDFKTRYKKGRAISAPQIGVFKQIILWNANINQVIINPVLTKLSDETFELWDDCMSFPDLLVKVNRSKHCTLTFYDTKWQKHVWELANDLSELIQHEVDHLNGILATQCAIDQYSFRNIKH